VDGFFDDCQDMVKSIPRLKHHNQPADSINIARWLHTGILFLLYLQSTKKKQNKALVFLPVISNVCALHHRAKKWAYQWNILLSIY
jgi:threonine synthase